MTVGSLMQPGWHSEFIATFVILIRCCVRVIRAFYTIEDFLQMIQKHKIEVIYMNPKDIFQMIKSETIKTINFEDVCLVVSVGAHMSIKMAEELQQYLPNGMIISTYAISDIGGAVAELSDLRGHVHQLVGKVRSGCQFVVLDNDGNRLGPKKIGEFGIKNTIVPFPGYYKNDKMTKESMNDDGFFYTGDCGYLDEEGNIFLTERKKFNIPYCGKMINQNDVERFILENVKGVAGVCVVDFNSDEHGTVPYIAVIPEKGKILKETEIIKTVMEHHPFEFETKVFFFEQLPMTISGKYRKHLVREMIMEANHV